jgi:predicted enzyme related to lactoylglutathione lyase
MLNSIILIPVNDWNEGDHFYKNVMRFLKTDDYDFCMPGGCSCVRINLIIVRRPEREGYGLTGVSTRFPIFRYSIEKDFFSYCKGIIERGGNFDFACENPGGYFARIIDPFGNTFEVMCDSFEEADKTIDPFQWPFYNRY